MFIDVNLVLMWLLGVLGGFCGYQLGRFALVRRVRAAEFRLHDLEDGLLREKRKRASSLGVDSRLRESEEIEQLKAQAAQEKRAGNPRALDFAGRVIRNKNLVDED